MNNKFETQFGPMWPESTAEPEQEKAAQEGVEQIVTPEVSQAEADPRIEAEARRMVENAERVQEAMNNVDPEKMKPEDMKSFFDRWGETLLNVYSISMSSMAVMETIRYVGGGEPVSWAKTAMILSYGIAGMTAAWWARQHGERVRQKYEGENE